MASWNDLPFEIKSDILRHLVLADIQHRVELHRQREADRGEPSWPQSASVWVVNLLDAVPDMDFESKKIVNHIRREHKKKYAGGVGFIETKPPAHTESCAIWAESTIIIFLSVTLRLRLQGRQAVDTSGEGIGIVSG